MSVSIILTSTVNVQCKSWLLQVDKNERLNTYLKSVKQWLNNTNFHIILVENNGYKYEELSEELSIYKDRFEIISFIEQDVPGTEYLVNNTSKGDSELFSIQYAFKNSQIIKDRDPKFIIKITARYYIPELENFLSNYDINNYDVITQNNIGKCELVGSHVKHFYNVFNTEYNNEDTFYRGHVESMYKYRCSKYENAIRCKEFNIEPTRCGGQDYIATTL